MSERTRGRIAWKKYEPPRCEEQRNIFFLKVLRAGGSTVHNILWRFGISRGLTAMIFRDKHPYPDPGLHPKLVDSRGKQYNIMAEHSIYNVNAIRKTMPNNTVHIAIVRDQLSHLRSVLKFFDLQRLWQIDRPEDPIKGFLQDPEYYAQRDKVPLLHNTQNRMAFEFGYQDWNFQYPPGDFDEFMERLDQQFKLVIVLDHLQESLVLMRRYFCWKTKDILYLQRHREASMEELTDSDESTEMELSRAARDWSASDAAIYDFFAVRLMDQMTAEPDDFANEVTWFAKVIKTTSSFCKTVCKSLLELRGKNESALIDLLTKAKHMSVQESPWDGGFTVTAEDCVYMALAPDAYRAVEFTRQYPEICRPNPSIAVAKLAQELKFDLMYCSKNGEKFPFSILVHYKGPRSDILPYCSV